MVRGALKSRRMAAFIECTSANFVCARVTGAQMGMNLYYGFAPRKKNSTAFRTRSVSL